MVPILARISLGTKYPGRHSRILSNELYADIHLKDYSFFSTSFCKV